jgi:hypothetical protein
MYEVEGFGREGPGESNIINFEYAVGGTHSS